MSARSEISSGALNLRVEESSPGLFCWIVTQLSAQEQAGEVCIDTSDHPYPTREAAMSVGTACLKAYKAAAAGLMSVLASRPTAPF